MGRVRNEQCFQMLRRKEGRVLIRMNLKKELIGHYYMLLKDLLKIIQWGHWIHKENYLGEVLTRMALLKKLKHKVVVSWSLTSHCQGIGQNL